MRHSLSACFLLLFIPIWIKASTLSIVPEPQQINMGHGTYHLKSMVQLVVRGDSRDEMRFGAEQIARSLTESSRIRTNIVLSNYSSGDIVLHQENNIPDSLFSLIPASARDEWYALGIDRTGIHIHSTSAKGIYYGVQSLIQLIEQNAFQDLPCMKIIDWPDLAVRGISDDISRGQVSTLDNLKRIIDFISRYKMNTYMPYMEDMIEFDTYPSIGKNRGALTKTEIRELVAYAKQRYVDVVPIFQTLGHYENLLSQPEFIRFAEFPGAACLDVSNDSIYVLLENMLKEVFDLFPSPYFHMGADESWDVGLGNSKKLVEQYGLAGVHVMHYKKVLDICKKYNRKVLMYGDVIINNQDILKDLPKEITVVDWYYGDLYHHPSTDLFKKSGLDFYVSPSVWNFQATFPIYPIAMPNIEHFTKEGLAKGAKGMINSNWGDYGAETLKEFVLYGYAWSAQCAWSFNESDPGTFSENYFRDFFGISDSRLQRAYETMSNSFNHITWHEFWYHPGLPARKSKWWLYQMSPIARISWMERTLPQTQKDLNELKGKVKRNRDHLDLLSLLIELDNCFILKAKINYMLQDKQNNIPVEDKELLSLIDSSIYSLEKLKHDYRNAWTMYYKEANYWMIDDKFNRLITYLQEAKDQVQMNKVESPLLTSKWIYGKNADSSFASATQFYKDIELSGDVKKAQLQLIGETQAKLYINDVYVDEVFERRHLSLLTEYKRIKLLDITRYLREGKNTIRIDAKSYENKGAAGINVCSKISTRGETLYILTDNSWECAPLESSPRGKVFMKESPHTIIAPNFDTNRPSWIER